MSNFLMCIMDKLRVTIKERDPQSRDTRDDNNVRLIEVNHIAGAEVNPLTWYSSSKEGLVRNSMFSEGRPLPFDTWLQRIVSNLLIDKETLKIANQEIVKVATDYVASIISTATGKSIDEYQDPPHWRDKINEYLQRGAYIVQQPIGRKAPQRKPNVSEEVKPSYIHCPRVSLIRGGPYMMRLDYHLQINGNETLAPFFFNKNLTCFFKSEKLCKKLTHEERISRYGHTLRKHGNENLPSLEVTYAFQHNYYGGTLVEGYYKDDSFGVIPWANFQPPELMHTQDELERIKSANLERFDVHKYYAQRPSANVLNAETEREFSNDLEAFLSRLGDDDTNVNAQHPPATMSDEIDGFADEVEASVPFTGGYAQM
ncbi:hypothetical protein KP509_39G003400 [Ceratopteris richardii]|nr:hypothetical protein KP509_39G003400 [Ceratopteris richardii]